MAIANPVRLALLLAICVSAAGRRTSSPAASLTKTSPYPYPVSYLPLTLYGQDVRMAYMDVPPAGTPNGRTVVLFHGMNFGGFYFAGPIEACASAGFRVVVPDQIGFGRSSKPIIPYNFHDMAANTRKLLQSLGIAQGGDRRPLDGRHAGGALRGVVSRHRRARGALQPDRAHRRPLGAAVAHRRRGLQGDHGADATNSSTRRSPPTSTATFRPAPGSPSTSSTSGSCTRPTLSGDWPRLAMVRAIYQQITYLDPVVYDWAHIKAKTLVLGGEQDGENFPALAKHIADTIPGAQLVLIPKVGHVPHLQVPEVFCRELLKFLKS